MNENIIKQILKILNETKETPTPKTVVTKLFNTLKADKEEDYKDFKEHVDNDCDCNCAIKAYYEVFNSLTDDELEEVIKENNITKDIYENFDKILCDKYISNNSNIKGVMRDTNRRLQGIFNAVREDKALEDMTKEELIDKIKRMNQ